MTPAATASPGTQSPDRGALGLRKLEHVVVLGANGTMGFGSAALFTQAVPKVTFLARTKEKAQEGLDAAIGQVRSNTVALRAEVGSYDDEGPAAIASADLIFEAVAEDPAIKKPVFDLVEEHRRPGSMIATVSSGLSINGLVAGRSDDFRRNFCGLHFFNPPNVIVGTELIPNDETDPEVLDFLEAFSTYRLGREIIRTADTPAFAGNRVGFKVLNECALLAETMSPAVIDAIVGPYTGRALTPLATIDLVGWDVHKAIVDNVYDNTNDEARETNRLPDSMRKLIDAGVLGNKSGGGFFKRKEGLVLDLPSGEYVSRDQIEMPDLPYVAEIADLYAQARYSEGLEVLLNAPGDEAKLARKIVSGYISYSFERVGEVCETITDIDRIMGAGFNWAPPSVLVDFLGPANTVKMLSEAGVTVPTAIADADESTVFFNHPHMNRGRFFVAA
ncbi:MAG: 3-hydroxyacyl-CoA dehydrogenase family protein [Acidimicrobiales bacterium]